MSKYSLPIILTVALAFPSSGFGQARLQIRASIWSYGTLCEFKDPPNSSGYSIKPSGDKTTLEVTDCRTLEKKHGYPDAVSVALTNNSLSAVEVSIDNDLTSVGIASADKQFVPAIAKRAMMEGPMGGSKMEFITKADASYILKLEPGQTVNIVYLIPKAAAGNTVTIGKLKPVKIE